MKNPPEPMPWIPILFLIILAVAAEMGWMSKELFAWFLIINFLTGLSYWNDKMQSRMGTGRRIPEVTLHLFGVLGGWPAALLMIGLLRHKSRKTGYISNVWVTGVANLVIWVIFSAK